MDKKRASFIELAFKQTEKNVCVCVRGTEKSKAWPVKEESGFIDGFLFVCIVVTTIWFDLILDFMCMSECASFEVERV